MFESAARKPAFCSHAVASGSGPLALPLPNGLEAFEFHSALAGGCAASADESQDECDVQHADDAEFDAAGFR